MPYKDPEKRKAYAKAHREANKEKIAARAKAYREANKEKLAARSKLYRIKPSNIKRKQEYDKIYRQSQTFKDRRNTLERTRLATDPKYKLRRLIETRFRTWVKKNQIEKIPNQRPPRKCIRLSNHGNVQYRKNCMALICNIPIIKTNMKFVKKSGCLSMSNYYTKNLN